MSVDSGVDIRSSNEAAAPAGDGFVMPAQIITGFKEVDHALKTYHAALTLLENTRREQEITIQRLEREAAALQEHPLPPQHAYVPLASFGREIGELRHLCETYGASIQEPQSANSAIQGAFGTINQVFAIYLRIIKQLQETNAKEKESISHLAQEIEALKNPFHHIDPSLIAICRGNLEMLLEKRQVTAVPAGKLLEALLKRSPQEAEPIYNLALFIANVNPDLLQKGKPLYETLRKWMLSRAADHEPLIEKRTLLLAALGKTPNGVPRDLLDPLEVLGNLQKVIARISDNPVDGTRKLLRKEKKTRAEQLFCNLVEQRLGQIPALDLEHPKSFALLSLFEQLNTNPKFSVELAGQRAIGATWRDRHSDREILIRDCILSCCNARVLQQEVLAARPDGDVPNPERLPNIDTSFVDKLAQDVARGPIQEQHRPLFLERIRREIYGTCSALTNLQAIDPNKFVGEFCELFATGRLPLPFQQILAGGDGRYALYLARLVYYHEAISHMKQGFEGFASHYEWDWFAGDTLPPTEAAHRMQILIKSFRQDPNFEGSAMIPKQVRWASHLTDLMTTGKIFPIYSDAGSGKTSTAMFTIRVLQAAVPEICQDKDVHLLSPFYTDVHGLHCHQLIDRKGTFYIDVANDAHLQDAVLVDEAHILDPGIKIVLRSLSSGKTREVEPLPMTATPVIPNDAYEPFKQALHRRLKDEHAGLSREYGRLCERFERDKGSVAAKKIQIIGDTIKRQYDSFIAYISYLPRAQREYFQKHLSGTFTKEDVEMLKMTMNWFLRAGEGGSHFYAPKDLDYISKRIPGGYKPLQALPPKEFKAALALFQTLDDDLNTIEELQEGSAVELTEELHEQAIILGQMKRDLDDLQAKLNKWERQDSRPHIDNGDEILRTLPAKRAEKFKITDYRRANLLQFSGDAAAHMVAALPPVQQPVIQLIYPGVRFTQDNFPGLIAALNPILAAKYSAPKKEIYFVYQDSHSANGDKGNKFAIRLDDQGQITYKQPMTTFSHAFNPETQVAVLLYDTTNKQGGDFNSLSRVNGKFDIAQFAFYNLTDNMAVDPIQDTSANDLYQALSRRRGISQVPGVLIGTAPRAEFFATANQHQWSLEKSWGARNASTRVAKKLLKAFAQKNMPHRVPSLRHRTLDVVHGQVAPAVAGLEAVHIVDELRKALLKERAPQEAFNFGTLISDVQSQPLQILMHEALNDELPQEDKKRGVVIPEADHAALWRIRKLQAEIAFLTEATVRYQPVIVE